MYLLPEHGLFKFPVISSQYACWAYGIIANAAEYPLAGEKDDIEQEKAEAKSFGILEIDVIPFDITTLNWLDGYENPSPVPFKKASLAVHSL